MGDRVTTKSIAALAKVSQATVSLALRDDPRISPETRKRVQDVARELGYKPDPALSALVAYRAQTRPIGDYGKIAVLHDFDREEKNLPLPFRQQVAGIRMQAQRMGFDVELFRVHSDEVSSMRLSRVLYSRGIRGLILMALRMPSLKMQWEHFSGVVLGEYFSWPKLSHVNYHISNTISTIYSELRSLGYRKIGYCNSAVSEGRKHDLSLGAYLKCLFRDGISVEDSPPLLYDQDADWSPISWLDQHQFDAVMSMVPQAFAEKLKGSRFRVPENLGVAGYSIPLEEAEQRFSGYAIDYRRMGAAAVELLQSMIHLGRRGVPDGDEYYDLSLRGKWVSRGTTRELVNKKSKAKKQGG